MTNDVEATCTTNNATIFPVVTDAVVGSVDLSCRSDVLLLQAGATRTWSRQGLCGTMWTQQQFIDFVVAHVSLVGYLFTVLQMQRTALLQTSYIF